MIKFISFDDKTFEGEKAVIVFITFKSSFSLLFQLGEFKWALTLQFGFLFLANSENRY